MKSKITTRFIAVLQLLVLQVCSSCVLNDFGELMGNAMDPGGGYVHWYIIPEGLATTVSGRVYDPNRYSPVVNVTVYVAEYIFDPVSGLTFSKNIDSTRTDQNGNFKIRFVTTGLGVQYQLSINGQMLIGGDRTTDIR